MRNSIPRRNNSTLLHHLTKDTVPDYFVDIEEELFLGGIIIRFELIVHMEKEIRCDQAANSLKELEQLLIQDLSEVKIVIYAPIEIFSRSDHF